MGSFEPIAIIGQSCILPGCLSPEELWTTVLNGNVNISSLMDHSWRTLKREILDSNKSFDHVIANKGGYVSGFEAIFNPKNYLIGGELINDLDQLFQWCFHAARESLINAGYLDADIKNRTGIVLGNLSYPSRYFSKLFEQIYTKELFSKLKSLSFEKDINPINRFMSGLPAIFTKKALGLKGDAFSLDAACASGLYAIKLASDMLANKECDMMLAGGVNAVDPLYLHSGFTVLNAMSATGRSRPFNIDADGLIPAEGAAFVVLKRLADAVHSNDNILGVIRGIGLSNDGRDGGFLMPSVTGQIRSLKQSLKTARVDPKEISLIECHATGTKTGDNIEVQSISKIFERTEGITIGSLKANLGHSLAVSGVAGLIKILKAIQHGTKPATPNAFPLLESLENSQFRVLAKSEPWEQKNKKRIACLNSFGFGGNNASLIIEEWDNKIRSKSVFANNKAHSKIAIVGIGIHTNKSSNVSKFFDILTSSNVKNNDDNNKINLEINNIAFPPKDLRETFGQQLVLLKVVKEAIDFKSKIDHANTSVIIGMGTDPDINRYILRMRLEDILPGLFNSHELDEIKEAIVSPLQAASVTGCMANILANRINNQYNFLGPSFAVSSEELSGDTALKLAIDALRKREINSAIVGAVDLCTNKIHTKIAKDILKQDKICDACVVLILKRYEDAKQDNDQILSIIADSNIADASTDFSIDENNSITSILGNPHACAGLLNIATAVILAAHKFLPPPKQQSNPIPVLQDFESKNFNIKIHNKSFSGEKKSTILSGYSGPDNLAFSVKQDLKIFTFSAENMLLLQEDISENIISIKSNNYNLAFIATMEDYDEYQHRALELIKNNRLRDGWNNGILFRGVKIQGELGFVYTGAASSYSGMGRDLLINLPNIIEGLRDNIKVLGKRLSWIYEENHPNARLPFYQLMGSSFMCQLHTEFSLNILKLKPSAVLGLSSGETNSMYAFKIWDDINEQFLAIENSGLYTNVLGGKFEAVREFWGEKTGFKVQWANWRIFDSIDKIKKLLEAEDRVYLCIINTENDCIIGGDSQACNKLIEKIGNHKAIPLNHDIAIHCPAVKPFENVWRELHTRKTKQVENIKFYSNYLDGVYNPTKESVADALTGQAIQTIDFPKIINKAWNDGIRIFLEHGPRNSLSSAINEILKGKPHIAIPLDAASESSFTQVLRASADLWCSGVDVDISKFSLTSFPRNKNHLTFNLHMPEIKMKFLDSDNLSMDSQGGDKIKLMKPTPKLTSDIDNYGDDVSKEQQLQKPSQYSPINRLVNIQNLETKSSDNLSVFTNLYQNIVKQHKAYLSLQQEMHGQYFSFICSNINQHLETGLTTTIVKQKLSQHKKEVVTQTNQLDPGHNNSKMTELQNHDQSIVQQHTVLTKSSYSGPAFSRQDLEILASGKISTVFGELFKKQDQYTIQVRMPEPPLLLCDRVLGIEGEAGSLGLGKIWTETDIKKDSWYLHHGRMPAGVFIEAGQADLLLISWLGIDFHNKGERAYRLLGCELTFHGSLPKIGDTLKYDIHVDGYAQQGAIRIFFFHYNCQINGKKAIDVRNGQAGFFSKQELNESNGVIWDPKTAHYKTNANFTISKIHTTKTRFTQQEVNQYLAGDLVSCFGGEFKWTQTHTRTPRSQEGYRNFIQEVTKLDFNGGPQRRGYLKVETKVMPDDWYFKGHFKNDPCMPGTLMADACLQLMTFYMVSAGYTIQKDGWRFEPVPEEKYKFVCRGQVTPNSKNVIYEMFVDEIIQEPYPILYAHVLCTVDGTKAFLCERLGLKLVPDWPLTSMEYLLEDNIGRNNQNLEIAELNGFRFDSKSLMHASLGQPTQAFGDAYQHYDDIKRSPRLPGPPYLFMSRISKLEAKHGQITNDPSVTAEYDIPSDAWYFRENGSPTMPYCVLMEVALQPCGWLATFLMKDDTKGKELLFRNLDGTATQYREITPQDETITTRTKVTNVSKSLNIIIISFYVECHIKKGKVFAMKTVFGFFDPDAMQKQKGLQITDIEQSNLNQISNFQENLKDYSQEYFAQTRARLANKKLLMLDTINGYWEHGGKNGLGYIRSQKLVDTSEWFFKSHFFQDPVQPGSLGVEAVIQLIQYYMLKKGMHTSLLNPKFEPVILNEEVEWHYRGQVTPDKNIITIDMDVLKEGVDKTGKYVIAEARLWVDGLKIYYLPKIGMRLIECLELRPVILDESSAPKANLDFIENWTIDIDQEDWLKDHKPTYTVSTVPLTYVVDMMARVASKIFLNKKLVKVHSVRIRTWIDFNTTVITGRFVVKVLGDSSAKVTIEKQENGSYKQCAEGIFYFSNEYAQSNGDIPVLIEPVSLTNPYESNSVFHGVKLQLISSWILGKNGASCKITDFSKLPKGLVYPLVLDAAVHCVPHDNFNTWISSVKSDRVGFPIGIDDFIIYKVIPENTELCVEARFEKIELEKIVITKIWLKDKNNNVLVTFRFLEILLPKGKIGSINPSLRKDFLSGKYVENVSISYFDVKKTTLYLQDLKNIIWLPGTVAGVYKVNEDLPFNELAREIAIKEHLSRYLSLHPLDISIAKDSNFCLNLPLNDINLLVNEEENNVTVEFQEIKPTSFKGYDTGHKEINKKEMGMFFEDLEKALIYKFVRHVVVQDPKDFNERKGRPVLYLANHQTGIESYLFACLLKWLGEINIKIVAKKEHTETWLGIMAKTGRDIFGKYNPMDILFFNREDPSSFFSVLSQFKQSIKTVPSSLLIHVTGTRSLNAGEKVKDVTSVLLDFAINSDLAIIPVKFARGLPQKNNKEKLEFPYEFGKQDYYLGKSIIPNELKCKDLKERKEIILFALNNLGPCTQDEYPLPGDNGFESEVSKLSRDSGISGLGAVLITALLKFPGLSQETKNFLEKYIYKNMDMNRIDEGSFVYIISQLLK